MNPAETAVILRQFNEWRRGDEDIPQFDPRDIGEAIDAAVEMIDRLEAAEKERNDLAQRLVQAEQGWRKAVVERDVLRAKIEQMEQQEPVAVVDDGHNADGLSSRISEYLPAGTMLYALPGAQTQGE